MLEQIPAQYLKLFPKPEDVFVADDLERHAQHFFPICSLDWRLFEPESEQRWLHFVQPFEVAFSYIKEDYLSSFRPYFQGFNQLDSFAFQLENGKYRFTGDWRYWLKNSDYPQLMAQKVAQAKEKSARFNVPLERLLQDFQPVDLAEVYATNQLCAKLSQTFYQKHQYLARCGYPSEIFMQNERDFEHLLALYENLDQKNQSESLATDFVHEPNLDLDPELYKDCFGNLDLPQTAEWQALTYIGYVQGYDFQTDGADEIGLYYDPQNAQVVFCVSNS